MSEGSEIKDRVERIIYQDLHVRSMPLEEFVAFRRFCFENTDGNYGQGIKLLMRLANSEKEEFIFAKLAELENKINEKEEIKEKPKGKTFGSGGKNECIKESGG